MTTHGLHRATIAELAPLLQRRELSPVELTQHYLRRIRQHDQTLNAFITVLEQQALEDARRAEQDIVAGGYRGTLHGIPIALKDLYYTRGVRTTGGSPVLHDFTPAYDATTVARLRTAGAVIIGKTHLHELAFGVTSNNPHFGPCRNPWDGRRIPGGSSGGSGAALTAGLCAGATGSDTGGSIRIPASLCGAVGIKPTYGRASRYGLLPLSWSLDHPGPMTRSVEDAATMLQAMAGRDAHDPTTTGLAVPDYRASLRDRVSGLRLGVPREFFFSGVDDGVQAAVEAAIVHLETLGMVVQEVAFPHAREIGLASNAVLLSEAFAYHRERLATRPEDFSPPTRTRLEMGAFVSAADYLHAQRVRSLVKQEVVELFEQVDLLATPTTVIAAPPTGDTQVAVAGRSVAVTGTLTRFTSPFNATGLPALSVPCGFTGERLPVGLQLVGKPYDEATVLRAGHAYEQSTDWHTRWPQAYA